jgi:L-ascorbate metabolism protein UlaG (beta-lactamase superfamily)
VTVSHAHPSHSYIEGVDGQPYVVKGPGEYEISGILIIGISAFHDEEQGKKLGKNTIYVLDVDEISVCHLGDLGHALTAEQIEEIDPIDVLMLPVGGGSTIDATVAAEVVRQLEPKIVVPMHYRTAALGSELELETKFLKEIGVAEISPQPKLILTRSNLPATSQVFLFSSPE